MFGGHGKKSRKSKSRSGSVKFYSVYTRKSVRMPKKSCCLRRIVMPHGRGVRYQLFAKKGDQKLYKFISAKDAEKYGDCKVRKSAKKSRKSKKKSRKSRKSHKAHTHRHKRSSKLRKYGRKKTKKHSHKHSHKKSKSKKGSKHKHRH